MKFRLSVFSTWQLQVCNTLTQKSRKKLANSPTAIEPIDWTPNLCLTLCSPPQTRHPSPPPSVYNYVKWSWCYTNFKSTIHKRANFWEKYLEENHPEIEMCVTFWCNSSPIAFFRVSIYSSCDICICRIQLFKASENGYAPSDEPGTSQRAIGVIQL